MLGFFYHRWIGTGNDVLQEGRIIALEFLRRFDNPNILDPAIISRRVYFGLIDLIRSRCKNRTQHPAPLKADIDINLFATTNENTENAVEIRDALKALSGVLTEKEREVLDLFKCGLSQSEIGRKLGMTRSGVSKRFRNIRRKLAEVLDA